MVDVHHYTQMLVRIDSLCGLIPVYLGTLKVFAEFGMGYSDEEVWQMLVRALELEGLGLDFTEDKLQ